MRAPVRTVTHSTETVVRHIAHPMGPGRESGPHLADLRAFVDACDGLPGDALVRINALATGQDGRHDVEIRVAVRTEHVADNVCQDGAA